MVFYENSGLQNLYDIVRYCQVYFLLFSVFYTNICHIFIFILSPKEHADGMHFFSILQSHYKIATVDFFPIS